MKFLWFSNSKTIFSADEPDAKREQKAGASTRARSSVLSGLQLFQRFLKSTVPEAG
jgi:hypothetical protein